MHLSTLYLASCLALTVTANPKPARLDRHLTSRACIPKPPGANTYMSIPLPPDLSWCGSSSNGASSSYQGQSIKSTPNNNKPNKAATPAKAKTYASAKCSSGPSGTARTTGAAVPSTQNGNTTAQYSNNTTQHSNTTTQPSTPNNSTMNPAGGSGRKYQATVTGYNTCLTQGMACGLTGSPGKSPTAAMSAYLIPSYKSGACGSCWKLSNLRSLNYPGKGQVPTIGAPLKSPAGNGMVVLINNSCAPGKDQYQPGAVGQCAQTAGQPKDKLGSETVLDLCSETVAVENVWGTEEPGMAVADVEEVDCGEWKGTVREAS